MTDSLWEGRGGEGEYTHVDKNSLLNIARQKKRRLLALNFSMVEGRDGEEWYSRREIRL